MSLIATTDNVSLWRWSMDRTHNLPILPNPFIATLAVIPLPPFASSVLVIGEPPYS
jgi:hypothetical protein